MKLSKKTSISSVLNFKLLRQKPIFSVLTHMGFIIGPYCLKFQIVMVFCHIQFHFPLHMLAEFLPSTCLWKSVSKKVWNWKKNGNLASENGQKLHFLLFCLLKLSPIQNFGFPSRIFMMYYRSLHIAHHWQEISQCHSASCNITISKNFEKKTVEPSKNTFEPFFIAQDFGRHSLPLGKPSL